MNIVPAAPDTDFAAPHSSRPVAAHRTPIGHRISPPRCSSHPHQRAGRRHADHDDVSRDRWPSHYRLVLDSTEVDGGVADRHQRVGMVG